MEFRVAHPTIHGVKRWEIRITDGAKRTKVIVDPETGKYFPTSTDAWRHVRAMQVTHGSGIGAAIKDLGAPMFRTGSEWYNLQTARRDGRPLAAHTLAEHEINYRRHIEPVLGAKEIRDVDTQEITTFLYGVKVSNRTRINIARTLVCILSFAVFKRLIPRVPDVDLPRKSKGGRPYIPTLEELHKLFPTTKAKLLELYKADDPSHPEKPEDILAIAACLAALFFGGLRPQEGRAAYPDQLHRDLQIFLVTRSMDSENRSLPYAKMGGERDPRYRGTFLVDRAAKIFDHYLKVRPDHEFLFVYRGAPIRGELLHSRLRLAAERVEVMQPGRRLIPYSGRYAFDTVVRPTLPPEILMALMGHIDPAMPDHYDIPHLLARMKQMKGHAAKINRAIG